MISNWDWPEDMEKKRTLMFLLRIYLLESLDIDYISYEPNTVETLAKAIAQNKSPKNVMDCELRLKRELDSSTYSAPTFRFLSTFLGDVNLEPIDSNWDDAILWNLDELNISKTKMRQKIQEFLSPVLGEPLW